MFFIPRKTREISTERIDWLGYRYAIRFTLLGFAGCHRHGFSYEFVLHSGGCVVERYGKICWTSWRILVVKVFMPWNLLSEAINECAKRRSLKLPGWYFSSRIWSSAKEKEEGLNFTTASTCNQSGKWNGEKVSS